MYYGKINKFDVANGEGVRVSLFVSGCRVGCKGCFNKETWNFKYGNLFTENEENEILEALNNEFIEGLTILGGESFEIENQEVLHPFVRKVRDRYPNKTIWMYSGYVFDKDILPNDGKRHTKYTMDILNSIDVLVDGPFIEDLKRLNLNFRGSSNQRIILMKETLKQGRIILSELNN